MPEEQDGGGLRKEQKMGIALLSIFAVFAIVLGFLQIRNTMYAPFALNNKVPYVVRDEIDTNEALMYRDTDKDGLNDFDELYVYITSPYLADTDSDGLDDKTEIEKGTSPICAEGQTCSELAANEDTLLNTAPADSATSTLGPPPSTEELDQLINNPAEIRKMLLASGFDKKILDQTSDADLMKMVKDVLNSTSTTP
ncbi:MAG: hypothetical protein A2534_00050 [Candidatus Magasanikbacteria bacterium RIFOXYD2_FULL_39_9]|uniref:Uncharacterized protein n=1 Tax=Candidatus Magasanikbacteria bacterium RIFOXYD1_FULL_40_23 TaxID=1798705 RepID=A0A1F6P9U7_9BACT|nr:MAG: hypothetical protein A2534_00050 [Candidatus Magasanikbacteria bacterium RIFOXYD2_FULL_39_9]OGH92810.1 MAG: hypothetical protein A2563_04030 [Candidatus Magasanikbacteria bacterium RIFOXYD1_FULL_40_23]